MSRTHKDHGNVAERDARRVARKLKASVQTMNFPGGFSDAFAEAESMLRRARDAMRRTSRATVRS
jgi:hypothetical protein